MARSTARKPKGLNQRKVILVLTEGTVTERQYLKYMQKVAPGSCRARLKLGSAESDPIKFVNKAVRQLAYDKRRKDGRTFDEIWCVFDYDAHFEQPCNLLMLLNHASSRDINVAVSNPSFELWLVLHCQAVTGTVHRHAIQGIADKLKLVDDKRIREVALSGLQRDYAVARQHARALRVQHQHNGIHETSNPSTAVWELVDEIR